VTELREVSTGTVGTHEGVNLIRGYGFHDVGNAERLKALYGHTLRYCFDWKAWAYYDGTRWKKDETGRAIIFAKRTITEFFNQAGDGDFKEAEQFARKCLNNTKIKSMLEMAQSEMPIRANDFDKDPWLLNCKNLTVDLRTGETHDHRSADFISKITPIEYKPEAPRDLWIEFLNTVLHPATIDYIQKAVGYSASGLTSEKAIFVLIGDGDNGKTTFLEAIRYPLGHYARQVLIDSLTKKHQGESNASQSDLSDLQGARFVTTSEAEEGSRLAESKLKYLSQGMGQIKSRRLYENVITFDASHTLWIDSNFRPRISGRDGAIWARLKEIGFLNKIENPDKLFLDKLKEIGPGILAWIIEGFVKFQAEGLEDLPGIVKAGEDWRKENDPLKEFIEDRCILDVSATGHRQHFAIRSHLRQQYAEWANDQGEKFTLSGKSFIDHLIFLGCKKVTHTFKVGGRQRAWSGIALNPFVHIDPEEDDENALHGNGNEEGCNAFEDDIPEL